ncbi:hypothetical protein [Gorillibacterium sp. CAU 1737]|uniref:hypothetical protein n=1 Tax=Gorillibacterium sp. CAU 1737 TaxID=3140362 RepID=UPI003260854C
MKKLNKQVFVITGVVILLAGGYYYNRNFTAKAIFQNVIGLDGYSLTLVKEQVPFECFVKPEWIAFKPDEKKDLTLSMQNNNQTHISLAQVINRGHDIYFNFHTTFDLDYRNGAFLYNAIFHEDGTASSPTGAIRVFEPDGTVIPVGQQGSGPGADFGFGIDQEHLDQLKNGIVIQYDGYVLYHYAKD